MPEVIESVAVGVKEKGDENIALFLKLQKEVQLTSELKEKINAQIKALTSPRHMPKYLQAVEDIPRTGSGKISEIAVKKVVNGERVDNLEALDNPEALRYFKDWATS